MTGRLLKAIGLAVAVTVTTGLVGAQAVAPNSTTVEVAFHPLPEGKAIFSAILAHSNGKVYVGGCYNVARLIEFDPKTRAMRVVARMTSRAIEGGGPDLKDPVLLGDLGPGRFPQTRWKFAQDKIHTQLLEGRDGRVYGATHTKVENADATRSYPGGHWFAYDPKTGKTEDLGWSRRHEGIITACYDRERHILYGITWPTGYLVSCKPDEKDYAKRLRVLDLACSRLDCSPRYFDVVKDGRVYMCDGATGDIRVYLPKQRRLRSIIGLTTPTRMPLKVPAVLGESPAWRNWWMCGTRSPDGMHIFTTGQRGGHLTEIDATQGKYGVVIDHGRTVPWGRDEEKWSGPWSAALVFGSDGLLYHTVASQLLTYSMKDHRVLDVGRTVLKGSPEVRMNLGGGTCAPNGVLYFYTRHKRKPGVAVLDPVRSKPGRLLRVSKRVVMRPLAERGFMLP